LGAATSKEKEQKMKLENKSFHMLKDSNIGHKREVLGNSDW
jgi:hypothetical protein